MKTREQIKDDLAVLKSRDSYTYWCEYCGKECTGSVKSIRQRQLKREGLFCSQTCVNKSEKWVNIPCTLCGTPVTRLISQLSTTGNIFCSHVCSATLTNRGRVMKEDTKKKISGSLLEAHSAGKILITEKQCKFCSQPFLTKFRTDTFCSDYCQDKYRTKKAAGKNTGRSRKRKIKREHAAKEKVVYTPVTFVKCNECEECFIVTKPKSKPLYCSDKCRSASTSRQASERLSKAENRKNLGRGKPSWMESSFAAWLDNYNIKYETEVQFKNHDIGKYYYADFVFREISLIIELDGNHHRLTIEKDRVRDDYLKSYYNYNVFRVTHKEYRLKTKLQEIKTLLSIEE